jgi:hypothetical protein
MCFFIGVGRWLLNGNSDCHHDNLLAGIPAVKPGIGCLKFRNSVRLVAAEEMTLAWETDSVGETCDPAP